MKTAKLLSNDGNIFLKTFTSGDDYQLWELVPAGQPPASPSA